MTEIAAGVGVIASVATIVGAAFDSARKLYDLIKDYRNASETLSDLTKDLEITQQLLGALKRVLDDPKREGFPTAVKNWLQDLQAPMEACNKECDRFSEKLGTITTNSKEDGLRRRDKVRLLFQEKGIATFQSRLGSHKSTLSIALGLATITASSKTQQDIQDLDRSITVALSDIAGQIQGLGIALQSLSIEDLDRENAAMTKALQQHDFVLRKYLKLCEDAVKATPGSTINMVRRLEGSQSATVGLFDVLGEVGSEPSSDNKQPFTIDHVSAKDYANVLISRLVAKAPAENLTKDFFKRSTGTPSAG